MSTKDLVVNDDDDYEEEEGADGYDDEVDNLDLDSLIQTELSNTMGGSAGEMDNNSASYELFGKPLKLNLAATNVFYKSASPSAVSESTTSSLSSLKTASKLTGGGGGGAFDAADQSLSSQNDSSGGVSCFNTICEDDLVDQRAALRQLFVKEFFDKYEFLCDVAMGQFVTKRSKLSKSLQRKLANLYQLLHQPAAPTDGGGGIDQITIDRLIAQSPNLPVHELIASLQNSAAAAATGEGKEEELKAATIYNIIQNQEYKKKLFRSMRSIAERICIDALAICDQYHNQLQQHDQMAQTAGQMALTAAPPVNHLNPTTKLWTEVRSRGCQFLGPQMQDDVLRLILHALETMTRMSRKLLVLYVVYMLKKHYPRASKTSVGHVVQLLYRAGCFKVEKRENDSSLMELKKEFAKYPALRRQHDSQIIQIALESGIRMSPEQWSQKLFGDATHKSEMQSIIDKLHSQQTLEKLASDFYEKLNANMSVAASMHGHSSSESMITNNIFVRVKGDFEYLAAVNFEKKLPVITQSAVSHEKAGKSATTTAGSGAESLASDTESNLDHNELHLLEDDDFYEQLNGASDELKSAKQLAQQEQTKIVWPLLKESLHKTINILGAYIEYSSKMLTVIIANNSFISQANGSNSSSSSLAGRSMALNKFARDQSDLSSSNGSLNMINTSKGSMNMRPNGSYMPSSRGPGFQNPGAAAATGFKPNYMKQGGEQYSMTMKFRPTQNVDDNFMGQQENSCSYDNNPKLYNNRSKDQLVMQALIQQMGPNSNMGGKPNGAYNNNYRNQFNGASQYGPKQYNNNPKKNSGGFGGNYFNNNNNNNYQPMNSGFNGKLGNDSNNNMFGASNFLDFQDMQASLFDGTNLGMMMPPPSYSAFAETGPLFDPAQMNNNASK